MAVKANAQQPTDNRTFETNKTSVHDPAIIKQDSTYYVFCTGNGITVWSSKNMINWQRQKPVFSTPPEWAVKLIPGFKGHIWAPDISFHNGKYYLYYSVSLFGKNTSAIGVATNKTLNASSADFKWEDHGKVIQSVPGRDMWNAIDPNLAIDDNNNAWLTFGSFWEGIKQVKLDASLTTVAEPQVWRSVAKRPRDFKTQDTSGGSAAIEAPFIFKKGSFYYLFVSFDYCCQGPKSTYQVMVGRSKNISGPYIDKDSVSMVRGGGSLVVKGNKNWYGVGHNSVFTSDKKDYIVFHGYDATDNGRSKLIIKEMLWDKNDWPVVELKETDLLN